MIKNNSISGGMIPKVNNCIDVANNGVKGVVIIDGRKAHSILFELFSDQGSGTLICDGTEYPVKEGMLWLCRPTCNISGRMKLGYRYPV